MRLLALAALLTAVLAAQEPKPADPPEEDESLIQKEYSFNPIQAQKEVQVGGYYFKKGSYRAAAGRFREAAKWDENYAEAYLRLGEACEKLKDAACVRKAYEKFVALAPDSKDAVRIRKLLTSKR
jgi:tetratricopeptide (TPR) repeat protein